MLKKTVYFMLLFVGLLSIPAVLYTGATFYHLTQPHQTLGWAILVSVLFAAAEYVVKVPVVRLGTNYGLTPVFIQSCWVGLTLLFSVVITQKKWVK